MCPECGGAHLADAPHLELRFAHSNGCSLRAAQDATSASDHDLTAGGTRTFSRPPTATEVTLLSALGRPVPVAVTVQRLTPRGGVVRRDYRGGTTP